jgi:hypothetical protein
MDSKRPDFSLMIDLLLHTDSNYNYFAASKLKNIKELLIFTGQSEYIEEMVNELKRIQTPDFISKCDE